MFSTILHGFSGAERVTLTKITAGKDDPDTGFAIATYNIHSCLGTDGAFRPDRVAQAIRALDADVIGLQEVGWALRGPSGFDQFAFLERETGYTVIPGLVRHHANAHFGNAILSRHPVESVAPLDLSLPYHSPRGGIDARIRVKGRSVRLINVHLGLIPLERRIQIRRIGLRLLDGWRGPALVCGDLNHWRRTSPAMQRLHRLLPGGVTGQTYPSALPTMMFDRILATGDLHLENHQVIRTEGTRVASDHLPLMAWFRFEGADVLSEDAA